MYFMVCRFIKCNNGIFKQKIPYFHTSSKPILRSPTKLKTIGPTGWLLLVIPVSTFSLGVWQVQRKKWKENLLSDLQTCVSSDPVALPERLEDIAKLEYKPVHVRGQFLHDKELYLGPRSLLIHGDASTQSALVSGKTNRSTGYLVITPFKLVDRDETILINRGWVPARHKDPKTRQEGQITGVVDVIGVGRLHENRPNFTPKNQNGSNLYFYRDLQQMSAATDSSPVFLDATNEFDVPGGPIGGQTRISLRNEHLSYILTWFTLCGATSFMCPEPNVKDDSHMIDDLVQYYLDQHPDHMSDAEVAELQLLIEAPEDMLYRFRLFRVSCK